jgi:hypothetical protein
MTEVFYDSGAIWMTTTHFSYYAIAYDAPAQQSDWWPYLVAALLIIIAVLLIFVMRRGYRPNILSRLSSNRDDDGESTDDEPKGFRRYQGYIPHIQKGHPGNDFEEDEEEDDEDESEPDDEEDSEEEDEEEDEDDKEDSYTVSIRMKP